MDGLALSLWGVAMVGETIADRQLHHFKSQPENSSNVCQVGLWRYSRHPNYFSNGSTGGRLFSWRGPPRMAGALC